MNVLIHFVATAMAGFAYDTAATQPEYHGTDHSRSHCRWHQQADISGSNALHRPHHGNGQFVIVIVTFRRRWVNKFSLLCNSDVINYDTGQ